MESWPEDEVESGQSKTLEPSGGVHKNYRLPKKDLIRWCNSTNENEPL